MITEVLCCPAQLDADVGLQVGLNLCGKQSTNMWKVKFGDSCSEISACPGYVSGPVNMRAAIRRPALSGASSASFQ